MITRIITEMENDVKENYQKFGPKYLADKYGTYKSKITRIAKKFGLRMSHEQRSMLCVKSFEKNPNEFNVNHLLFENAKSSEVAYLLGFLWADGCITTPGRGKSIRCKIIKEDADNLKETFLKTGNWCINTPKVGNKNPAWKSTTLFYTNNKHLFNYLDMMGYRGKNGLSPDNIINSVPSNLRHYWWRGFFDGDGCIYTRGSTIQINFAGPFDQDWNFVEKILQLLEIKKYTVVRSISKKNHKSSCIRFCSKLDAKKFLDYIYFNREIDGIGLNRKYKKYKKFDFAYKQAARVRKNPKYFSEKLYVSTNPI